MRGELDTKLVLQGEIKERIDFIGPSIGGDFHDGFALVLFERWIADLQHLHALPSDEIEKMWRLELVTERLAELRLRINLFLHLDRLIERSPPRFHIGEDERILHIDLTDERLAQRLRKFAAAKQRLRTPA